MLANGGNTLYVGGSGYGNYTKIRYAIENASDSDTVFVYDDSSPYYECIVLNKSISLIGEDKNTTIIDADEQGTVIVITEDDCRVSGFTLINPKRGWSDFDRNVVEIHSDDNIISDNIISIQGLEYTDSIASIYLLNASNNQILNNTISEDIDKFRFYGIIFGGISSYNMVSGNKIMNYRIGIDRRWGSIREGNVISENNISFNTHGIGVSGDNVEILDNKITNNNCVGINIYGGKGHIISGNKITYNGLYDCDKFNCGIMLKVTLSKTTISNNLIAYNKPTGVYVLDSTRNTFTKNNFIDNGDDVHSEKYWANAYFWYDGLFDSFFNRNKWKENWEWIGYIQGRHLFTMTLLFQIILLFLPSVESEKTAVVFFTLN